MTKKWEDIKFKSAANRLPRYHILLRSAFTSSENLDYYDIDSNNPRSVETYYKLARFDREDRVALVKYILKYGEEILEATNKEESKGDGK